MAPRPLSILHVIDWIAERYGGPVRNVRDVCAALADRGHRVDVLTTDRDGKQRLSESERRSLSSGPDWEVVPVPTRGPGLSLAFARRAWTLVGEADVVHLHGIYNPATAVAGAIAIRRQVPFVQQLHGAATEYHWRQKRWKKAPWEMLVQRPLLTRASATIVHTEIEAVEGRKVFPAARMRLFPPPLIDDEVRIDPVSRSAGQPPTIGFLGRLSEKKGAPILLAAFARIAAEFPDARLIVAGPDDEGIGSQMQREVERLELGGRVSFPGMVVGAEKAQLLADFDVFVLPSANESFGIAVAEAMAAGVPVVVTEHVGIAGEIEAAGAGLIAPRSDEGVAIALRRLLSDSAEAEKIGVAGRRLALESYTRSATMSALERIYEDAVG
ncbi:MAG: glycosyltransferase [Solirubrobacterales bacterium]